MPHTAEEKKRALARVKRIRGQCDALERALEAESDCAMVLHQLSAIRGAISSLMTEVMESHIRGSFSQTPKAMVQRGEQVEELLGLFRSYMK